MRLSSKRTSFYLLAALVGAGTFGVWLPNALAAMYCNPNATVQMCKNGTTTSVPPPLQPTFLSQGATCGPCSKPPTSPVSSP